MQVIFIGPVEVIEHIRAGTLRALAVTPATRSDALRDFPTVGDQGGQVRGHQGGVIPTSAAGHSMDFIARSSFARARSKCSHSIRGQPSSTGRPNTPTGAKSSFDVPTKARHKSMPDCASRNERGDFERYRQCAR